jgi:hypothetical protein
MTRYEAIDVFEENLKDIQAALKENMSFDLSQVKLLKMKGGLEQQLALWFYILQKESVTKRYTSTLRAISAQIAPRNDKNPLNIERAKSYPIDQLMPHPVRRRQTLCPLHNEKTPSCEIRKNNTFVCYGCGEYGDSIDLYQKLHKVSFVEAVKALGG